VVLFMGGSCNGPPPPRLWSSACPECDMKRLKETETRESGRIAESGG
jgi:hypothetical protein